MHLFDPIIWLLGVHYYRRFYFISLFLFFYLSAIYNACNAHI